MTNDEILNYPYRFEDADTDNLRGYFYSLLFTLLKEGEGFSGKRPFGNSGWEYDIIYALVEMKAVSGKLDRDEDGFVQDCTYVSSEVWDKIFELLAHAFYGDKKELVKE